MPKHYYQIGEVAKMLGIKRHTLRYWETEFPKLKPGKNNSGKRNYTLADIEILKTIKYLLHEQNYSIEGARKKMSSHSNIHPEEEIVTSSSSHVIKSKLLSKIENIQDIINLTPENRERIEKKRAIKSKLNQLRELLFIKEKKQELIDPASSDSIELD
jgi:DNA-binding transcriptional MerR regulator